MQLRNMQCKLKQERRNFKITEIKKKYNFEVDAEQGYVNRGVSVFQKNGSKKLY